jgi:hypothetical protein
MRVDDVAVNVSQALARGACDDLVMNAVASKATGLGPVRMRKDVVGRCRLTSSNPC